MGKKKIITLSTIAGVSLIAIALSPTTQNFFVKLFERKSSMAGPGAMPNETIPPKSFETEQSQRIAGVQTDPNLTDIQKATKIFQIQAGF